MVCMAALPASLPPGIERLPGCLPALQAFKCKVCVYLAERRRPECAAHPYAVERVQVRF